MLAKTARRRQADVHARIRMVWLWLAGLSVREISCHMHVSVTTVYRWVRRWQDEGTVKTRSYCRSSLNLRKVQQRHHFISPKMETMCFFPAGSWNISRVRPHSEIGGEDSPSKLNANVFGQLALLD